MSLDLKVFRKSRGISQSQMAELLDVSKSTISMVENERRELPRAAIQKFDALQQEKQPTTTIPGFSAGDTFQSLKDMHMLQSEEYLLSYKKDCEFALHKYEKRVRDWTKRYEKAAAQFFMIELAARAAVQKIPPKKYIMDKERERIAATETLLEISRQKPEIVMIKIAGLKQELRSIKAMLGKQKRYLGMKEMALSFQTGTTDIENAVKKKELPKNE